jgi:hypothetical protein
MKSIARRLLLVPVLATAFAVLPMLSSGAQLSSGCTKVQGTVTCTTFEGPGNNQAGVGETTVTQTQGNTSNFSPAPQSPGVTSTCKPPKSQGVC